MIQMHKQFDLWCISILTKKKTFSANDFLSGTIYTFKNIGSICIICYNILS